MKHPFDAYCADCRAILLVDDQATGLEALQVSLEKLLANPSFIEERLGRDISPPASTSFTTTRIPTCTFSRTSTKAWERARRTITATTGSSTRTLRNTRT